MAKTKVKWRTRYVKKKSKKRPSRTIPLAAILGFVPGIMPAIAQAQQQRYDFALQELLYSFTGYSTARKKFEIEGLKRGLLPVIGGLIVHKVVGSWLGLNRVLGRAKVPVIRV